VGTRQSICVLKIKNVSLKVFYWRNTGVQRVDGKGIIYKVKSIEKSPWIIEKGVDQYIFSLEFVERDFGEMLADMAKKWDG
jgi:hypothetical protein